MDKTAWLRTARCTLLAASACAALTFAQAQSLDSLKGLAGGAGGSLSSLGGVSSGSMGNAAGIIEYCLKNKYLGGSGVSQVKDGLLGKMPGGQAAAQKDSGYLDGAKGLITGSDGKKTDLTSGMTDSIKKQACELVLKQGQSFL
ncbi:MAG: DUF2501 domain-containing protein [Proteobacteria bacterium]|nr:DUF2501 domain-containing protein [Pseudomonadota bacterium]